MSAVQGQVDWSGENPGMYLREADDGPYVALASFFRVVVSPHGPGHAAFVLLDPAGRGDERRPNVCLTDNEPLARYLADGFVRHFGAFRDAVGLREIAYRRADRFVHEGDHRTAWREIVTGSGVHLELEWSDLYDLFAIDVPPESAPTGQHRLLSVFVSARSGRCELNGVRAGGRPSPRDAFGRASTTAFLAFAESWIRPD